MVIPSGQSMVADYYPEERRGAAFGALYLTGALGAMLGGLYWPTPSCRGDRSTHDHELQAMLLPNALIRVTIRKGSHGFCRAWGCC